MFKIFKKIKQRFKFLDKINNSKYFAGLVMIMLNIGSKYVTIKLSKTEESYLEEGTIARQMVIFSIVWIGTRDIFTSFVMTAVFMVLTEHLFHEESKLCIIPHNMRKFEKKDITKKDIKHAKEILEKAQESGKIKNYSVIS